MSVKFWLNKKLTRAWYQPSLNLALIWLLPFSLLFQLIISLRFFLYQKALLTKTRVRVPVIVVGNISLGGTGKTPIVIALAHYFQNLGYLPGIVSRGVGGRLKNMPHLVKQTDAPAQVGDEALLILAQTQCPLVVAQDRAAAAQYLLQHHDCDLIISDDGLQHYALERDLEIVVVDAARGFGNQCLLPAGPLREPVERLKRADFILIQEGKDPDKINFRLEPRGFVSLLHPHQQMELNEFPDKKIHAVAAIGHPQRFFASLEQAGFEVIPHDFIDHHLYRAQDFAFEDDLPIVMTEKDAVKCQDFANERFFKISTQLNIDPDFFERVRGRLKLRNVSTASEHLKN